jgi:hypothetical protein
VFGVKSSARARLVVVVGVEVEGVVGVMEGVRRDRRDGALLGFSGLGIGVGVGAEADRIERP